MCRKLPLAALLAFVTFAVASSLHIAWAAEKENRTDSLGRKIDDFSLRDFRGADFRLSSLKDQAVVVVAFFGTECPLANQYAGRLRELAEKHKDKGVGVLIVNSNSQDSVAEIGHWVRTHKLEMPVLKDAGNVIADKFGAQRTPEMFVLDRERTIRYHGRIDDQYGIGYQRPKATVNYLADAVEDLLAGKEVRTKSTEAVGCVIGRAAKPDAKSDVTYSQQIARIFQKRCVECHREGDIAPFALTSYSEAAGWAEMIHEVVQSNIMPPWHADEKHGKFMNDARLSADEKDQIAKWVRAGAPEGDSRDLPPPRKFTEGWRIPTPDVVFNVTEKPFQVQATGEVRYQHFVIDPGFKEDKWIRAAEIRPGNRAVVHHVIAFVKPPGVGRMARPGTIESDWLVATAPGARPMDLPEGLAKFVPAGSKFVFQVHYTPNGSPQTDQSKLGLVFADPKKVKKEVGTWRAANHRFSIPPGADNHEVRSKHTFHADTYLLAMFPHMHLRGKSFRYEATYPDGRTEILLDVPRYDFAWQNSYLFAEPKRIPAGTQLLCTAHFDNSEQNLSNPDSKATVRWGDQTWEEMMVGYFSMVLVDQDLTKDPHPKNRAETFLERLRKRNAAPDAKSADSRAVKSELDPALAKAAEKALVNSESLEEFLIALQAVVPQVDRIDVTVLADNQLHVKHSAQVAQVGDRRRKLTIPAANMALAKYAQSDQPAVDKDLSQATSADLKYMSQIMSSAAHVPVRLGGLPAVVSFWSEDRAAFPDEAVAILKPAAAAIVKGR